MHQTWMLWGQTAAESYGVLVAIAALLVAMLLLGLLILFVRSYKRCPSNRVLVIYGRTGKPGASLTIHGGAAFVWPLIQDYAYLSLEPIQIEVPLRGALSAENIRVNVPSVFTVAIDTRPEVMQNAAIRLLGLSVPEIRKQAEEMIFGQLRQVIASMHIEEINRDRDKFLEHVQHSLEPELAKIGLQLINVNITDITDESGYIDAIGQKAASLAIQQARGDVADNEKMGETRVASAERDKSIQVANARKEQMIGTREAEREQAVRLATLEKEKAIGESTAAFEKDVQIKLAEQQMRIKVAEADASAIDGENQAAARVAASQADLLIKKSEAYERSEARKRQAEAAVQEIQNRALAKAALAEAERVEAEQRAKLEAPAKAQKARILVEAEAAAEKRRIEAQAEADAIYLKLEAEARGQYEILAKKGEGLKRIVEACGGANQAFQMLILEHLDRLAETSAQAISNIKFDKVVVWESGGQNGKTATADFLSGMSRTLPPMLQVLRDIAGVELPPSLVKLTEPADGVAAADGAARPATSAASAATTSAGTAPSAAPVGASSGKS
jgi:flotillin